MKKLPRLAVLLVVLSGIPALVAPAQAATDVLLTTYYTDATETTAIGQRGLDCQGHIINWGLTTPFYTQAIIHCP